MRLTGTKSTTGIKGETYMRMNIAAALMAGTILVTLTGCSPALESATAATQITASAEKKSETTTEKTAATRASEMTTQTEETTTVTEAERSMTLKIGERKVPVTWEDNASVEELKKLAANGLTIKMSKYGGFEQVGSIGKNITSNDKQTKTAPGDIVLYAGNKLVVFYGSNSWAYTRLGKINMSKNELKDLLGKGDVTVTLTLE